MQLFWKSKITPGYKCYLKKSSQQIDIWNKHSECGWSLPPVIVVVWLWGCIIHLSNKHLRTCDSSQKISFTRIWMNIGSLPWVWQFYPSWMLEPIKIFLTKMTSALWAGKRRSGCAGNNKFRSQAPIKSSIFNLPRGNFKKRKWILP